jgi:hypothetical protein
VIDSAVGCSGDANAGGCVNEATLPLPLDFVAELLRNENGFCGFSEPALGEGSDDDTASSMDGGCRVAEVCCPELPGFEGNENAPLGAGVWLFNPVSPLKDGLEKLEPSPG